MGSEGLPKKEGSRMLREVLTGLGVIISLVFVGYEIRQNTQVSRAEAIQGITDQSLQIILAFIEDEQAAKLYGRVLSGDVPADFDEFENTKLRLMFMAALRTAENRHRQVLLGIIEDKAVLGTSAAIYRTPYLSERWDELRLGLSPDFAAHFEVEYGLR
jgi:hypothetical protein